MEFSVSNRKQDIKTFLKTIAKHNSKTIFSLFNTQFLTQGSEGSIYRARFNSKTIKNYTKKPTIIKALNLNSLLDTKEISMQVTAMTSDKLYQTIYKTKTFYEPLFIEIISQTLTDQLTLQKICPHFTLNYYWDYDDTNGTLFTYNEYINKHTFQEWAHKKHSTDLWFNALFQIMYSLIALKRYFNMLHTDLHFQNILVYKVKSGGYWKYKLNNKTYYLPNLGYIFVLHDFGFAWIPRNMFVKWHYKHTLKYITRVGKEYYDLSNLLISILSNDYKAPNRIKQAIYNEFSTSELEHIMSKKYYVKENSDPEYLNKYPNITKNYESNFESMETHFQNLFKSFRTKPVTDTYIESYSLDKKLNKNRLPSNLRKLVLM